ncbi:phage terminase large subunit family protein [Azospirillum brasilense]|uniref:phage terminase large subunit family protein n=1 Tax=Azospirillum brasilense TaxID=192 RepID=UPI001EDB8E0B|nr:terminase gpA endonuclease subunit [Azospirillum brasilense]UKJ74522.1 phage terminase large subunit family protein [Azospirillum brasilense]
MALIFEPKPFMSLSEWAVEFASLSPESTSKHGEFTPFGYQYGMLDVMTDPTVKRIAFKKSARTGGTMCLNMAVGYFIHWKPSPILFYGPREDDVLRHSHKEVRPMLRDVEVLAKLLTAERAKDGTQTILRKTFRNGASLEMLGAQTPDNFRAHTARLVVGDEINAWPVLKAGSQIDLAHKRTETFWDSLEAYVSTPTDKGASRIGSLYEQSDQRRCFVPCPHCSEAAGHPTGFQVLEWGSRDTPHGIKWDKDEHGNVVTGSVRYVCRHCLQPIHEGMKAWMDRHAEWRQTADFVCCGERQTPELWSAPRHGCRRSVCTRCGQDSPFNGMAGIAINTLYSMQDKASWSALVADWNVQCRTQEGRKAFWNETLGEDWEEVGDRPLDAEALLRRREVYEAVIPDGVAVLVAGIDRQTDRIEISVWGYGRDEEAWLIEHHVIMGDPAFAEVYEKLDAYLLRTWAKRNGTEMQVRAACMDTQGGFGTQVAYRFCQDRGRRNVWGIRGEGSKDGKRGPVWPPAGNLRKRRRTGYAPVQINVNSAKDTIRARLSKDKPGAEFVHFPANTELGFFHQLLAETTRRQYIGGLWVSKWEKKTADAANEALDCAVYAYAAFCGLVHHGLKINAEATAIGAVASREMKLAAGEVVVVERAEPDQAQADSPPAPKIRPSSWRTPNMRPRR